MYEKIRFLIESVNAKNWKGSVKIILELYLLSLDTVPDKAPIILQVDWSSKSTAEIISRLDTYDDRDAARAEFLDLVTPILLELLKRFLLNRGI